MDKNLKQIAIGADLHQQVKATATLYNMTLREFTERALRKYVMPDIKTLVDQKPVYTTEGEDNA